MTLILSRQNFFPTKLFPDKTFYLRPIFYNKSVISWIIFWCLSQKSISVLTSDKGWVVANNHMPKIMKKNHFRKYQFITILANVRNFWWKSIRISYLNDAYWRTRWPIFNSKYSEVLVWPEVTSYWNHWTSVLVS